MAAFEITQLETVCKNWFGPDC